MRNAISLETNSPEPIDASVGAALGAKLQVSFPAGGAVSLPDAFLDLIEKIESQLRTSEAA